MCDAVMETKEMAVSLAVTSSNPIEDQRNNLSSLHEMHLGMKENNFLPSKHASHSFFSKS